MYTIIHDCLGIAILQGLPILVGLLIIDYSTILASSFTRQGISLNMLTLHRCRDQTLFYLLLTDFGVWSLRIPSFAWSFLLVFRNFRLLRFGTKIYSDFQAYSRIGQFFNKTGQLFPYLTPRGHARPNPSESKV